MSRVRYTHRAREDLLEIWSQLAERASEAAADRIYDRIGDACLLLNEHPLLGRTRTEIHPDARSLVIERWLALYRLTDDGVQIVRIIDGARDLTALEDRGRVARPFGFALTDPGMRISRTKCGPPHLMRNVAPVVMWR
jgi:toxin ParE1/3/4